MDRDNGVYEYTKALEYFRESGLADKIMSSKIKKGLLELPLREIPLTGSKYRQKDLSGIRSPRYFSFVEDHIRAVIGLVEENSVNGSVKFNTNNLVMTESAVDKFRSGYAVLIRMYQ